MKNSIKTLIAIVTVSLQMGTVHAQSKINNTGVYLTEQDYKMGKLSYVLAAGDKMHTNGFLEGKNVNLTYQGKSITLAKSQVFGYREDNQDFRFYQNEAYRVLDTAGFLLYSKNELAQDGKGPKPVARYFYSVSTDKPILSLTLQNIYKSFPAESGFRYNVQSNFHQDADLINFDKTSKQYEIKFLYLEYKHHANVQHASI